MHQFIAFQRVDTQEWIKIKNLRFCRIVGKSPSALIRALQQPGLGDEGKNDA